MANGTKSTNKRTTKTANNDRSFFGTYVSPIYSSVANQFTRRGQVFTGKNNTQNGRYSK